MRLSKRSVRSVPLLGCAVLGSLLAFGLARSLRSSAPLDWALAVADTSRWRSQNDMPIYFWSGRDDLTYLRIGNDGATHLFRLSGVSGAHAKEVEGPAVLQHNGFPDQISPDGRWFVEWHQNTKQHIPTFIALDGTERKIVGQPTEGIEGVWTPGGDAMLSAVWRGRSSVDSYDPTHGSLRHLPIPQQKEFYTPQRVDSRGRLVGFQSSAFIVNLGISPAAQVPRTNYPNLNLIRFDLAHPTDLPELWSVPVPGDVDYGTCLLSPAGDRILWVLHGDTTPPLLRKWRRYLPDKIAGSVMGYRWLVSGLHGENMREIASFRFRPDPNQVIVREPYSRLHWLPDGKHISFIHDNTLYIRPID